MYSHYIARHVHGSKNYINVNFPFHLFSSQRMSKRLLKCHFPWANYTISYRIPKDLCMRYMIAFMESLPLFSKVVQKCNKNEPSGQFIFIWCFSDLERILLISTVFIPFLQLNHGVKLLCLLLCSLRSADSIENEFCVLYWWLCPPSVQPDEYGRYGIFGGRTTPDI